MKEKETIKWRNLEMNRGPQGNQVFNNFISFSLIYVLSYDFSEKIREIDNK